MVESLSVDLAANDLAAEHRMIFAKYDPILARADSGYRFRILGNHQEEGESDSASAVVPNEATTRVEVVFTQGAARVGYVGDMLATRNATRLLGGSMTVLGGQTLSCWVLPKE